LLVDLASDNWIGAIRLNYMPIPPRSFGGTMPFNPEQGMGKNESPLWRALAATPLLAMSIYGSLNRTSSVAGLASLAQFLDFGTVYGIMLIESARRANLLMPMQMYVLCLQIMHTVHEVVLLTADCYHAGQFSSASPPSSWTQGPRSHSTTLFTILWYPYHDFAPGIFGSRI
jgi:hypothetical protein